MILIASNRHAAADAIRITASGAAIRLSPSESAAVINTPLVGSIFEVSASEGDWYTILMPPDDQGLRRYGYIQRRFVELVPGATIPTPSAEAPRLASPSAAAAVGLAPDWEARVRQARARRGGGRAKYWSGVGVAAGGGIVLAVMAFKLADLRDVRNRNCTDADPCYEYAWGLGAGVGGLVAGSILRGRGRRQIDAANLDLIKLETERIDAQPRAGIIIPLFEMPKSNLQPEFAVALGDRVAVACQLSW
jgi:hypothetical protein